MAHGCEVVIVGRGAIGARVEQLLQAEPTNAVVSVLNSVSSAGDVESALARADIVVEAASVDAARTIVPPALMTGADVVICSCGVLADEQFVQSCRQFPGRMIVPAGAIGGLDIMAALTRCSAGPMLVRHTTIKRPAALGVDAHGGTAIEVFRGNAREAARVFPRTSNSSIVLALATVGLEDLEVVVVADPGADRTRHQIDVTCEVGMYSFRFENAVDPASGGRTSIVTAGSVAEVIRCLCMGSGPGMVVL